MIIQGELGFDRSNPPWFIRDLATRITYIDPLEWFRAREINSGCGDVQYPLEAIRVVGIASLREIANVLASLLRIPVAHGSHVASLADMAAGIEATREQLISHFVGRGIREPPPPMNDEDTLACLRASEYENACLRAALLMRSTQNDRQALYDRYQHLHARGEFFVSCEKLMNDIFIEMRRNNEDINYL